MRFWACVLAQDLRIVMGLCPCSTHIHPSERLFGSDTNRHTNWYLRVVFTLFIENYWNPYQTALEWLFQRSV